MSFESCQVINNLRRGEKRDDHGSGAETSFSGSLIIYHPVLNCRRRYIANLPGGNVVDIRFAAKSTLSPWEFAE